jgi:hypothetical protein
MSWISWLVGKENKGIIGSTAEAVDRFVHTQADKEKAKADWEKEVTSRWVADSQAPITRLVRPFSYLFVTLVVFLFGALDSSLESFKISDHWLDTFTNIYITMTLAYFGGRSFEKVRGK